ncbi:MAG: hypothetical protein ABF992_12995 [Lentilactobacillus hilgardii]
MKRINHQLVTADNAARVIAPFSSQYNSIFLTTKKELTALTLLTLKSLETFV